MQHRNLISAKVRHMNFLAHLLLAGDDEGLRLGAMLGDFIRGHVENSCIPDVARRGVRLHRHIDQYIDSLTEVAQLREQFEPPFRRYSGIIIDLAFDHELALHWEEYATVTLEKFDCDVRDMLARHQAILPENLLALMRYADRRGLFAAYRDEAEIIFSLQGIGRRLSRPNPLYRVADIWNDVKPALDQVFTTVFPQVQQAVSVWLQGPGNALFAGTSRVFSPGIAKAR
jgi:acyl carrier protein phosphodiesterase